MKQISCKIITLSLLFFLGISTVPVLSQIPGAIHKTREANQNNFSRIAESPAVRQSDAHGNRYTKRDRPPAIALQTFVVTDPGDEGDANLSDGLFSPQTLRSAIQNANLTPELDVIVFSPLVSIIPLQSALPESAYPLVIDGYINDTVKVILDGATAGSAAGLQFAGGGSAARNLEIRNFSQSGVILKSKDSSAVQGCFIHNNIGSGIELSSSRYNLIGGVNPGNPNIICNNRGNKGYGISTSSGSHLNAIVANYVGTISGVSAAPNSQSGIYIESGSNIIYANLISGNEKHGVEIISQNPQSGRNYIESNFIGVVSGGKSALPNAGDGIRLTPGLADTMRSNTISGNGGSGIDFGSDGNPSSNLTIQYNYIGTSASGSTAIPNASGINGFGNSVFIEYNLISGNKGTGITAAGQNWAIQRNVIGADSSANSMIPNENGGIVVHSVAGTLASGIVIGGGSVTDGNIISGDNNYGVKLSGEATTDILVQNNIIGMNLFMTSTIPNSGDGVIISEGASKNVVKSNLIAGNLGSGIRIESALGKIPYENSIQSNFIGIHPTTSQPFPNTLNGITISNAPGNLIGGIGPFEGNIISGNGMNGIEITGKNAYNNGVQGNFIGTNLTGNAAVSNELNGILIAGSASNLIGGAVQGGGNIISGNKKNGIHISGADSNGVMGNYIGIDIGGTAALPNMEDGIHIAASNYNLIGGAVPLTGNIISGNNRHGIALFDSDCNGIQGNFLGIDNTGNAALPNAQYGIFLSSSSQNFIGGISPEAGNTISGNLSDGVFLILSDSNAIASNSIGANAAGKQALANNGNGVALHSSSGNVIGGVDSKIGNIISGNTGSGVLLSSSDSNLVACNAVGTDAAAAMPLANGSNGITIESSVGNVVGGLNMGNAIAFNTGHGIQIKSGNTNVLSQNIFFSNTGLGIELGTDGVTPNDTLDSDTGPNEYQNFPELNEALAGTQLMISGKLKSSPDGAFQLQFFSNSECNPSGFGEGRKYLGSLEVLTLSDGVANFQTALSYPVSVGEHISAIAIDHLGNTSEFSRCIIVIEPVNMADLAIEITTPTDTIQVGSDFEYTLRVTNNGPLPATGVIVTDSLPGNINYISHSTTHGVGTYAGGVLKITIPSLAKDEEAVIIVRAHADTAGIVVNIASVGSFEPDNLLYNNRDIHTLVVATPTSVDQRDNRATAREIELYQNYPNPFSPATSISFHLSKEEHVFIRVYDHAGRELETLVPGALQAGFHSVTFKAKNYPSGVYRYVVIAGKQSVSGSMIHVR